MQVDSASSAAVSAESRANSIESPPAAATTSTPTAATVTVAYSHSNNHNAPSSGVSQYDFYMLSEQFGELTDPDSGMESLSHRRRKKLMKRIQKVDWRANLVQIRCKESMHFPRILRNTSVWCLQQEIQHAVNEFNSTGNEEALLEFRKKRNYFLRMLILHLNQFFAIITDSSKVLFAERLQKQASGIGSSSSSSSSSACVDYAFRVQSNFRAAHAEKQLFLWTFHPQRNKIILSSESLVDLWIKSPHRRACESIVFDPSVAPFEFDPQLPSSNSNQAKQLNLWSGFAISHTQAASAAIPSNINPSAMNTQPHTLAVSGSSPLEQAIAPFLDHIRIIWCRGDMDLFLYVISCLASLLQKPWLKLEVALVLLGLPGTGKGILFNAFLSLIIGSRHSTHVTGLEHICGTFNGSALANACLVFVDEAVLGSKQESAKFKTLITERTHVLTNKYTPAVSVRSYTNFILASNEKRVVEVDAKSRRFCVMQTDDRYAGPMTDEKKVYFDRLLAVPPVLVARYLYEFDLSGFDSRRVPVSDMQRQQKRLTLEAEPGCVALWLLRCLETGKLPVDSNQSSGYYFIHSAAEKAAMVAAKWVQKRRKSVVYEDYVRQAGSHRLSNESFWKNLLVIVPARTIRQRESWTQEAAQLVVFPPRNECIEAFRRHMGDSKWPFQFESEEASMDEGEKAASLDISVNQKTKINSAAAAASSSKSAVASYSSVGFGFPEVPPPGFIPLDAIPSLGDYHSK